MSSASGFRGRLILQAVVTALFAMTGSSASGWTIPTLLVAAGAVFVGLAMRQEPSWRWYTVGYEGFAIAYGLVGLVSGHYVPGTLVAGWTLYYLLSHDGAGAFAGTPTWAPPSAPPTAPWGPPALAGSTPAQAPFAPPPMPAVPAVFEAPPQLPVPRPATMTILPRK
ncbi:MAG: hypothetical protein ABR549_17035 [Mycobacteriales bacterium]